MTDSFLGKLFWYELLTTDVADAVDFYTHVVGWTVKPYENPASGYHVIYDVAGRGIGGIMARPAGVYASPHWSMYIGAPNVDEAAATIERLGGGSMSPAVDVPHIGRMQTMRDPQGATFVVMAPEPSERFPDAPAGLGDVAWHELYTTDAEAAMAFYTNAFGWRPAETFDMGAAGTYRTFARDFPLGGMMTKPAAMAQVQSYWGLYFRVADVDAAVERVRARGGHILNEPRDVPGGDRILQCADPKGALFNLTRLKG